MDSVNIGINDSRNIALENLMPLKVINEHSLVMITYIDPKGKFLKVPYSLSALLGYLEEELVELNLEDIIFPKDYKKYNEECTKLLKGEKDYFDTEVRCKSKSGETLWIHLNFAVVNDETAKFLCYIAYITNISDRKYEEERLLENNKNLEQIINEQNVRLADKHHELIDFVENAPLGLHWVGPDGIIQWANKFEMELLGYSAEEYIGHHISEFHDETETINDILTRLTNNETLNGYEAALRTKDGSIKTVLISSNVFRENGKFIHTRCFTKDITERKQFEQKLKEHEDALLESESHRRIEFQRMLEKLPAGAYTCDTNGLITFYNEKAAQLWGRTPKLNAQVDRFCGSFKLYIGDEPIKHDKCWMALALTENKGFNGQEIRVERPNGEILTVMANASPIHDKSGKLIGAVNVLVDITEMKKMQNNLKESHDKMEERVRDRTSELKSIVDDLEIEITDRMNAEEKLKITNNILQETQNEIIHSEKLASLGRFSAGIAHEIRNPLANISSLAQILADKNSDPKSEKLLNYILENSEIANRIIKELLDFASPHNVNFEKGDVGIILSGLIDLSQSRCEQNNINLTKKIDNNLPSINLNRDKLQAAFLNFISNAIQAMPEGGSLEVSALHDKKLKEIIISFRDTGVGILKENLDKVMEPFFTTKDDGTGLGLSLAYHIIHAHSGSINIESELHSGTKIIIKLPVNSETTL